jgi:hypothetical protein
VQPFSSATGVSEPVGIKITEQQQRLKRSEADNPDRGGTSENRQKSTTQNRLHEKQQE